MLDQLQNIATPENLKMLSFFASGFALGRMKPRKMGAGFVSIVTKVTPKPIKKAVLSFLNRFAKGVDAAIKDSEVK